MKIRSGFVSNSSSSSFVIVMTSEQEKEWKDKLNVYEKQVIESDDNYLGREEKDFSGQKVIVYSGTTGNFSFYDDISLEITNEDAELSEDEMNNKYGEFYPGEFWYSAQEKLPKGVLQTEVDSYMKN